MHEICNIATVKVMERIFLHYYNASIPFLKEIASSYTVQIFILQLTINNLLQINHLSTSEYI